MKTLKDLAEHLAKDPRVNQRAFERFNYYLEAIRCTTAQHRDYLNRLSNNAGSNPHLTSLVINVEMFLEKMDECAIIPTSKFKDKAPESWNKETAEQGFTEHLAKLTSSPSDHLKQGEERRFVTPEQWDKDGGYNEREGLTSDHLSPIHEHVKNVLDASKYLGSDGSGDCEECKEAFDPKKWLGGES